jgi:hypothetical protein
MEENSFDANSFRCGNFFNLYSNFTVYAKY